MGRRPAPCGTVTRYKRGCRCPECLAAYRADYEAHADENRARVAAWRKANPEKRRAQIARRRERHRERLNAEALARYYRLMAEDPERVRAQRREWVKTPKGAMANRLARHARRGAKPTPEAVEYAEIILRDPCAYGNGPAVEIDHIIPIAHGGTGDWDDLTPACRSCNAKKGDRSLLVFLAEAS